MFSALRNKKFLNFQLAPLSNLAVALLLLVICLGFFTWLQMAPVFSDPDSFYHTKIAALMNVQGVIQNFPYLPFTVLGDYYIDHHLLYHIFLLPFVKFLPPLIGAKLAQVILASLTILVFYFLLARLKVKGAWWWALSLLLIEPFVFRLSLVKAQPFSLIIFFLGIYLMITRRLWWLFILSFVYVWSYGGWILMLLLAGLWILISSWQTAVEAADSGLFNNIGVGRPDKKEFFKKILAKVFCGTRVFLKTVFSWPNFKLGLAVAGGLAAGLIANPYFPKNLSFYWAQVVQIAFVNYQSKIGVGGEWYPLAFETFLKAMALPLAFCVLAGVLFLHYRRRLGALEKHALVLMLLFLFLAFKAKRNLEYLAPMMVFFPALVLSAVFKIKEAREDWVKLKNFLHRMFSLAPILKWFWLFLLISVFGCLGINSVISAKQALSQGFNFNYLAGASAYLEKNSQAGDIVFHSDWDDFPALFYYNSKDYYINGLDPTFMYLKNQDTYWQWADITMGKRYAEMRELIKNSFHARYVLAGKDHQALIDNLNRNFYFLKVYEDSEAIVYKVL